MMENTEPIRIRRNMELKLKLSQKEKEELQKRADSLSLKLSQYIRTISLNAVVIIDKNEKRKNARVEVMKK